MAHIDDLDAFLADARVDPAVFELAPDYRAMLLIIDGVQPGPSDDVSEAMLTEAEESAAAATAETPVEELPHIAAWREAFRAFGAKPQRTRNSAEALIRRAGKGLPRVNKLTDVYNALSVRYQIPIGGENLDAYAGAPALIRSDGTEDFDTAADGEIVIEHPEVGEVVWSDPNGATCRRWNWRQCRRTGLTEETTSVIFFLDALGPLSDDTLNAICDELLEKLSSPEHPVRTARRLIGRDS